MAKNSDQVAGVKERVRKSRAPTAFMALMEIEGKEGEAKMFEKLATGTAMKEVTDMADKSGLEGNIFIVSVRDSWTAKKESQLVKVR